MRRLVRVASIVAAVAGLWVGVLWLVLPGATRGEEGTPDPLLGVRRPVVNLLRRAGILRRPGFVDEDLLLPQGSRSETFRTEADGTESRHAITSVRREPVYRGLLWRIGTRVTAEFDARGTTRAVRLVYRMDGEDVVAGEGVAKGEPAVDGSVRWRVVGFVPDGWTRWALTEVGADGRVTEVEATARGDSGPPR